MHDLLSIPHDSHDREPLGNPSVSYGTLGRRGAVKADTIGAAQSL